VIEVVWVGGGSLFFPVEQMDLCQKNGWKKRLRIIDHLIL
jgi:hypothetical protein